MPTKLLTAAALLLAAPALAQVPMQPPKLSLQEATQLTEAAGFRIGAGTALNVCGTPSKPKISYLDLNGDGLPEALATDHDPSC